MKRSNCFRLTRPLREVQRWTSSLAHSAKAILLRIAGNILNAVAPAIAQLPTEFQPSMYLKLNPDVDAAGVDPTTHFLRYGRREGRLYSIPAFPTKHGLRDDRETILVVSHDASRTGAPMVSLNIVQEMAKRYNVVVLLLGGGPLSESFRLPGTVVMTSQNIRGNYSSADVVMRALCLSFSFKFAIVNSIESRWVLPQLSINFVPTVTLIHEFACNTRPVGAFREAFLWSNEIVFSANVTLENALTEYPDLSGRSAHIVPQGRCNLALDSGDEDGMEAERVRIRHLIRPKGAADRSVVVLGAGFVHFRKGIDLFIDCAARVVRAKEGTNCRFVWIGKGFDPESDTGYSVYLMDQIRRSGLQERLFFIDETTAIETAYEEADLLLLSSRLDPLPNVAIDCMAHGVPVLCFNQTTGIADFLTEIGLRDYCVAQYLDSKDMAEKILAFANSPGLRETVSEKCRESMRSYFTMEKYIAHLDLLATSACERTNREKRDVEAILNSGMYRRDFCTPQRNAQSIEAEVKGYVRSWAAGVGLRKPLPGFHPGVYLERHGLTTPGVDPFADYLRAGCPKGPWNNRVIAIGSRESRVGLRNSRVALHVHAHYVELLPEIITRIANNRSRPDLFVSVTDERKHPQVASILKDYDGHIAAIQLVPNRGRDIGPLFTEFGRRLTEEYDLVGHVHAKKTSDVKDASVGRSWYLFLLENLLGGDSGAAADRILIEMENDAAIGMVFPDDPNVVGWTKNKRAAEIVADRIGLRSLPENFVFPIGTMFWAKAAALLPFVNLHFEWDDYPEEPLPYDGTVLHAIERLFSLSLSLGNWRFATTNINGLTR